ncbi:hypothetical protein NDU88_003614 [Pleurodeles waltl]|uniref:Uncharacterized protein n=1 Tax=Pleurodeles waltl TaxID=8319 RepID=A0AAV7KZ04_PLEWA|nr:hypothetical protein NDU88_003614 [Pleurodeles waltl]
MATGAPCVGAGGLRLPVCSPLLLVSLNCGQNPPGAASRKRAASRYAIYKKGVGPPSPIPWFSNKTEPLPPSRKAARTCRRCPTNNKSGEEYQGPREAGRLPVEKKKPPQTSPVA